MAEAAALIAGGGEPALHGHADLHVLEVEFNPGTVGTLASLLEVGQSGGTLRHEDGGKKLEPVGRDRKDAIPDERVGGVDVGEERIPHHEPPTEALLFRQPGYGGEVVPPIAGGFLFLDLGAHRFAHGQVAADVERLLLLGPGVAGAHHGLEGFAVRTRVVVGLHEILGENFPVEVAIPLVGGDQLHLRRIPRGDIFCEGGVLLGDGAGRAAIEIHEDKAVPHLRTEGPQAPFVALKTFGLAHLGTGLESAVEFKGPEVVGTKEKAGVAAAGLSLVRGRHAVAVVAEAGRHDVHGAVRADARKDTDVAQLGADDDERLAEDFEIEEVSRARDLGDVAEGDPIVLEEIRDLPAEELLAGVSLRRQGRGLGKR